MHFKNLNFYCFVSEYNLSLINSLPKNVSLIYRNYEKKIDNKELLKIKKICTKKKIKFYLSNDIKKAIKLNLDGAYFPSFNKNVQHNCFSLKNKFKLLGSSHNLKEIRIKEIQKINNIFITPIFKTKNYKTNMGIYRLISLVNLTSKNITCLGGLNKNNIKILMKIGIKNLAGIKLFNEFKG